MFGLLKTSQAALIETELANLTAWAEREWPRYAADSHGNADLQEQLDGFMSEALDYARQEPLFKRQQNSVLARCFLIGICRSGSHPISEIEAALGVSLPPEVQP